MKRVLRTYFLLVLTFGLVSCKDSEPTVNDKITSFSVVDQKSVEHKLHIDNNTYVISNKQAIPNYVNLSLLVAYFETNNNNAILKVNDEIQVSGQKKNDFTKERVYDLYVSNEKKMSYTVKITKGSLQNNFLSFKFPEKQMEPYQPKINTETGEIMLEEGNKVPTNVDISALKPEFTTSETGAVVKVDGVTQVSGNSSQDFSKPVVYTIQGEDGTSKEFTVSLALSDEAYLTNPVYPGSYADPTVIRMGNMFYVYVTGSRVRGYKSTDLVTWKHINDSYSEVFTSKPNFTVDATDDIGMWAPDINYFDGKYVMYYSLSKWGGGATCGIGVAVSNAPGGPFIPPAGNPNGKLFLSSEIGVHNSIDPCFYEENGKRYLFWGSFYGLYMTELTEDGMKVKDIKVKTKVAGEAFEATYVHKRGEYYYLFVSAGTCCNGLLNSTYRVMVGRSKKLEGPYVNKDGLDMKNFNTRYTVPSNYSPVVLQGDKTFGAPGHNSRIITDDNGVDWMLYHSYVSDEINTKGDRQLMLDKVEWDADGWPLVGANGTPSLTMKVAPVFKK